MRIYPSGARIAGRYEIAGRPLMGGMGIVYVCFDHREGRPVALKTFKPEYLPDRVARDRFLREGTVWVDLGRHPHIVHCYGVERIGDGREVYLVLELVAKEERRANASLRSWLVPGQPLPVEQSLLFALQIARGMSHATATSPGFVHRDLKPENVLVGADRLSNAKINRVRVTDFGLASALQEMSEQIGESVVGNQLGLTQLTRGVVGTPLYMAPEQWQGERASVQTDIYALGCILYEMLAGDRVVEGNNLSALERAHCEGRLRPVPTGLPKVAGRILARCLTVEPGARYAGWGEVEKALAAAYKEVAGQIIPRPETVQALGRAERVAMGWSHNAIGASYADIGKTEIALRYYDRAREVGQTEGEQSLEASALNQFGLAYAALGKAHRAVEFYEQALTIFRQIGDQYTVGSILCNIGQAYAGLGDPRRAGELYEQALAVFREIGDRRDTAILLNSMGLACAALGNVQQAIEFYEQALIIDREIDDQRGKGATLGNLGLAYAALGDMQKALGLHKQALATSRQIGNRQGEGNALGNIGSIHLQLGNLQAAIGFYEQALAIDREINDRRGEAADLGNLGSAYRNLGDAWRAIGCFEQALSIWREIGDRRGEAADLGNLGAAYLQLGYDVEQAIGLLEQQLEIAHEIGDRYQQGNALYNLGQAHQSLGNVRQALALSEQALTILHEIGDIDGVALGTFHVALLFKQLGDWDRALLLAQEAGQIWAQMGSPRIQQAQELVEQIMATPD